ncbi:hypothetical protein BKA81DRAFT_98313 [Phyllosticta paracitricarpa]|uniref:Uncharacterized protein n=1 Tax=Phyllosticta paracitricarpa TaxID=2016321 RepID=A0ABR1NA88_9PEZI
MLKRLSCFYESTSLPTHMHPRTLLAAPPTRSSRHHHRRRHAISRESARPKKSKRPKWHVIYCLFLALPYTQLPVARRQHHHHPPTTTSTSTKKKKLHPLVSAVAKCFQLETLEIALCWLLPPIVARSRDGRWHLRPTTTQPRNTSPSIHLHSTAQHSSNSNDGSVGSGNMGTYATNQTRQTDRRTRRMRLALFSTPQSVSQSRLNVCTFVYMYVRGWHEVAKPSTLPRYVCSHLTAAAAAAAAAVLEVPPSWF